MSTAPVFEGSDGRFVATDLGRGPWDPRSLHGGAPAALLMRELERLPAAAGLLLSRVTYEFMRPAPVGPLEVRAEVVRPGRRVQLLEGSIAAGGVEVVRARALQIGHSLLPRRGSRCDRGMHRRAAGEQRTRGDEQDQSPHAVHCETCKR